MSHDKIKPDVLLFISDPCQMNSELPFQNLINTSLKKFGRTLIIVEISQNRNELNYKLL